MRFVTCTIVLWVSPAHLWPLSPDALSCLSKGAEPAFLAAFHTGTDCLLLVVQLGAQA